MIRTFFTGFLLAFCLTGCSTGLSNQRADKVGNTVVGQSLARSKDAVCRGNLSQIRSGILVINQSGEAADNPTSLSELKGFPPEMLACPIGKEPYQYNKEEGTVKCGHPGHGKY